MLEEGMITWDGCMSAIIGTATNPVSQETVVVYSYKKLVRVFMRQGMSEEEAIEWVDYNIVGAFVGPRTPIIVY